MNTKKSRTKQSGSSRKYIYFNDVVPGGYVKSGLVTRVERERGLDGRITVHLVNNGFASNITGGPYDKLFV